MGGHKKNSEYLPLTSNITRSIKEMRTKSGRSLISVADDCGYTAATLSRIENGLSKSISLKLLECISEETGGKLDLPPSTENESHLSSSQDNLIFELRSHVNSIQREINLVSTKLNKLVIAQGQINSEQKSEFHPDNY